MGELRRSNESRDVRGLEKVTGGTSGFPGTGVRCCQTPTTLRSTWKLLKWPGIRHPCEAPRPISRCGNWFATISYALQGHLLPSANERSLLPVCSGKESA